MRVFHLAGAIVLALLIFAGRGAGATHPVEAAVGNPGSSRFFAHPAVPQVTATPCGASAWGQTISCNLYDGSSIPWTLGVNDPACPGGITITFNWGDGSAPTTLPVPGDCGGSVSAVHPYLQKPGTKITQTDTTNDPNTPNPTITANITIIEDLAILNDSTGQTGGSLKETMVVGQKVKLELKTNPAVSPLPDHYEWTLPSGAVKSYGLDSGSTSATTPPPVDTSIKDTSSVEFYWGPLPGTFTVTVAASAPGDTAVNAASDTFTVKAPTVTGQATTCGIGIDSKGRGGLKPADLPVLSMGFNDICGSTPGIAWNLPVTGPANANGQLALTQVITSENATKTHADGSVHSCASFTDTRADTSAFWAGRLIPLASGATATWPGSDSPLIGLRPTDLAHGNPVAVPGVTGSAKTAAFTDYLMYQPAGGIWVPLGTMSWAFIGSATANNAHANRQPKDWTVKATNPPPTLVLSPTSTFPTFGSVWDEQNDSSSC